MESTHAFIVHGGMFLSVSTFVVISIALKFSSFGKNSSIKKKRKKRKILVSIVERCGQSGSDIDRAEWSLQGKAYLFILGFSALTPFRFLSSCSFTIIAICPVFDFGLPLAEFIPPCDTTERIVISYNFFKGFIALTIKGLRLTATWAESTGSQLFNLLF